ncbi:MAG: HlyD family secretion protein [Caulobacteraceae bacterium]|nr:HlyD family secretion protein [Caulobacter sp.]
MWPWVAGALVLVVFSLVVLWIIFAPHAKVRTADAYVTAHYATIAPRVQGQVALVPVTDNQHVRAGDLLLALDDRDFRAALQQAQANLASDQAQVAQAAAQVERQPALIRQAQAQVDSALAHRALSAADTRRYTNLAATGAGTVQQRQQSATALRQDEAAVEQARAELAAQVKQLDALRATLAATNGKVAQDEAQVAQARLNLSYTRIFAPIDGTVDQRQVQVGNILQAGSPVMTLVPLEGVYVMANYRELSLRHMRPGQPARIHVDAYDMDLDGVVDSIPAATGAAFSPIPPNNATGNFTKIVQRLPVKIVFVANQRLVNLVRVGMSTEVTVDTGLEDVVAEQRRHDASLTARPVRR